MSFRLVPNSMTLNGVMARISRYYGAHCVKVIEDIPKLSATEM